MNIRHFAQVAIWLLVAACVGSDPGPVASAPADSGAASSGAPAASPDAAVRDAGVDARTATWCEGVTAALCDDYERSSLQGAWSAVYDDDEGARLFLAPQAAGQALNLEIASYPQGGAPDTHRGFLSWTTPSQVAAVAWEADVWFDSLPGEPHERRLASIVVSGPGNAQLTLALKSAADGKASLAAYYRVDGDGDGGSSSGFRLLAAPELVPGSWYRATLQLLAGSLGEGPTLRASVGGFATQQLPVPIQLERAVMTVFQGAIYTNRQPEPWQARYDNTTIRTEP